MENELEVYEGMQNMVVARPPEAVLAEAKNAAAALTNVLKAKKNPVMMNGEQYLEFEDWQTVGRFYGITAKIVSTEIVDFGNARGFQARAVAIRTDGMEVSAAEAMCLNDEEKWSTRPKYEYINNVRTKVGDVAVPLFQLKSMAQTRACAKALRNVLAWVVVLAGYKPTPAEEIQDMAGATKKPVTEPQKKTEIKNPGEPATEPQIKAIHAMLGKLGIKDDFEKHKKVSRIIGLPEPEVLTSLSPLTKGQASKVIETLTTEGTK